MSKSRKIPTWGGFLFLQCFFLLFLAASFAQQAPKPQPEEQKSNSSNPGHQEAKPAPDKTATSSTAKDAVAGGDQDPAPSSIDASQYVGSQACADCHENVGGTFSKNPHAKTITNKRVDQQGCEACHGPGKAHAESGDPDNIVRFESVSKAGATKICSKCHLANDLGDTVHTQHSKAAVGCLDCHSVHFGNAQEHWIKSEKAKLCSTCHEERQP
jgi:predicted CXXCH cytochrome family protein